MSADLAALPDKDCRTDAPVRSLVSHGGRVSPLSRTLLGFSATGVNVAGKTVTRQVPMQTAESDGWWPEGDPHPRLVMPDGEGVLLKVMTTIARTGPVVSAANGATACAGRDLARPSGR